MYPRLSSVCIAALLLIVFVMVSSAAEQLRPRVLPEKPTEATVQPGFDRRHIEVKFLDDLDIGLTQGGAPFDRVGKLLKSAQAENTLRSITTAGGLWRRTTGDGESRMDELVARAEQFHEREIADLNNYFILTVPDGIAAEGWLDQLNGLDEVEIAQPLPLPMKPPFWDTYVALQGYLDAATDGIDAWYAWLHGGGRGAFSKICDFEYSWDLAHHEFDTTWANYATIIPMLHTASDPYNDKRHGTAVLGELAAQRGWMGMTGIANEAGIHVAPTYLDDGSGPAWLLGVAMNNAMMWTLTAGDVMLIEQQMAGPNYVSPTDTGLIPIEWYQPWYNIVLTATGNGIHVVEAAGNGYQNLDDPVYNTGHAPFAPGNHSRAIIVGAGAAPAAFGGSDVDRSRLGFSNYGSRLDLQGWGEAVRTTGYGDLYNEWPDSTWDFTAAFSGTSSASPIVAGAVALVESIYQWRDPMGLASPFGVDTVRSLLINTGSPQQSGTYPATQHIGPRPNLRAALGYILNDYCESYKTPYPDYAPSSLPDFDQIQSGWYLPDTRYTHDGPVALANCFWWFDSKYETSMTPPPTIADNYPLVQAYGAWDDHDAQNVIPFVDSLAFHCMTNLAPEGPGTPFHMLQAGAVSWMTARGVLDSFDIRPLEVLAWDSVYTIRDAVEADENVILLLGFWHNLPGVGWVRVGGHYVTVAGICQSLASLCISDPWMDVAEGEPPAIPGTHAHSLHNDAANVSGPHGTPYHDRYELQTAIAPGKTYPVELAGYPMSHPDILRFQDMNPGMPPIGTHPYTGLPVYTALEWALIIAPAGGGACCGLYTGGITGNTNCDVDGKFNLSDITELVDRVYISMTPLCCEPNGDLNCDTKLNLSDITQLITFVYLDPVAGTPCPCP